ncbi:MAG TPA: M20/M25/M40 family metallo-hydrolase [Terriglobales bacterium]|nr:M20/M25/M40 family metallo-hydrolase [Terriglobales bacterium]
MGVECTLGRRSVSHWTDFKELIQCRTVREKEPNEAYYRYSNSINGKPTLWLHFDLAQGEQQLWTVDPLGGLIKDGYVYGRGAIDDKSMDAANLEIFLILHRQKLPLDRDVILLAEAGEAGTTQFGIDYMVAKHWNEIACEYAPNEGGDIPEENGKVQYVAISTTQKVPPGGACGC